MKNTFRRAFFWILLLALVVLFAVPTSYAVACAEGEEELPVGVDLDGYDAEIVYRSYTLSGNGLYYAFSVTIDKALFASSGSVVDSVFTPSPKIEEIALLLASAGYIVTSDGKSNGKITAFFEYENTVDYYVAHGMTGYDITSSTGEESVGFLFTDYRRVTETPFSSINTEDTILNKILTLLSSMGAQEDNVLLTYVYGTPYQSVKTDADRVEYVESSRLYLHSFDMTTDSSDRTIEIKQHAPNPTGWYVIAFLCALLIIAIPLTVMLVRKKQGGTNA